MYASEEDANESMFVIDTLTRPSDVSSCKFYSTVLDDAVLHDCCNTDLRMELYLNFPREDGPNPIYYEHLEQDQQRQDAAGQLPRFDPTQYTMQHFGTTELVCHRPPGTQNSRINLRDALIDQTITWYLKMLQHAGTDNLHLTMARHFYANGLKARTQEIVKNCSDCQKYTLTGQGYGHLATRETQVAPWFEVAIDAILGPWEIPLPRGNDVCEFHALTMIDTVTNLTEMVRVPNTTAQPAAQAFKISWLFKYPRPVCLIHDQGTVFMGEAFQASLRQWGIRNAPIGVRNPQANAVCERMHQVVGNILRNLFHANPPQQMAHATAVIDYALQMATYAMRTTVHRTLGISPGPLLFQRDMIMGL